MTVDVQLLLQHKLLQMEEVLLPAVDAAQEHSAEVFKVRRSLW